MPTDQTWTVIFTPRAEKEFFKLDMPTQRRLQTYLRQKIATSLDPRRFGKPLTGSLSPLHRYRVGDYRLLCAIEDQDVVVLVVHVGHRKHVYH